jgi:16S rRNA processing protein RimM
MDTEPGWIIVAALLRPQGRKGELLAELLTDFPERFDQQPRVWLAPPGFDGEPTAAIESRVASYWLPTGRNAGRIVLHFAGVDSIESAERLAGKEVVLPASERLPLEDGAAYISDLTGCNVYDRGILVGVVEDVQFPTTSDGSRRIEDAAPLLAVQSPEGHEVLIPFVKAFIVEIDSAAKTIRMTLPEGLTQVNR